MNKSYIKQIVAVSACVAVAIAALLIPVDFKRASAGGGSGDNAKIERLEELSSAVYGFNGDLIGSGKIGAAPESKYKSITFNQVTSAKVGAYKRVETKLGGSTVYTETTNDITLYRNITAYLAENASYYSIDTRISQYYRLVNNNLLDLEKGEDSYALFNTEIYIEESFAAVRFVKADVKGYIYNYIFDGKGGEIPPDGEILAKSNINKALGKWIYIPSGLFGNFGDLLGNLTGSIFTVESKDYPDFPIVSAEKLCEAESNFDMLWLLAACTADPSNLEARGKIYETDEDSRPGLASAMSAATFGENGFGYYYDKNSEELASVSVNLGNPSKPSALMRHSASCYTPYEENSNVNIRYSSFSEDSITFKNIGNTKVKAPNVKNALSLEKFYGLMEK